MRIVLPSNSSMNFYPANTLSRYTVRLDREIELKDDNWEVGLAEIVLNNLWYNVKDSWFEITFGDNQKTGKLKITNGYYGTCRKIISTMNDLIKDSACPSDNLNFTLLEESNRVEITMRRTYVLTWSSELASILGYSKLKVSPAEHDAIPTSWASVLVKSERMAVISNGFHNIYVYCDICELAPIGDIYGSLLGIIPVNNEPHFVNQITRYERPLYVPLSKNRFQTITLYLMTDSGNAVQFESGKTVITI